MILLAIIALCIQRHTVLGSLSSRVLCTQQAKDRNIN